MFRTEDEKSADEQLELAEKRLNESIESMGRVVVLYSDVYNSLGRSKHRDALQKMLLARESLK